MKRLFFLIVIFAFSVLFKSNAQPCSGAPPAVTASSNLSSACNQTAVLTLSGTGSVTGLTFQWQDSVGGTWLNVSGGSGGTTTSYTTDNISSRKFYRCAVTCTSSAVTVYSNIISITSPCSLYYATRATGNSYSSIAGNASFFSWRNYASGANVSMPVSLPPSVFDFNYMGSAVTGMVVSTNGWLSFNTSVTNAFAMTGISASTTPTRALFPFWRAGGFINGDTLPTGVYYQISGSPGTRVLTVEWASTLYNMQVKLYEGTNNFEYRYGPMLNLADGNSSPVTQYKVLYTGPVIGNPVVAGQFRIQTTPNHSAFGTTDNTFLYEDLPSCNSSILFSLSNVGYVSQPAPPTIPVNDNPANATVISLSPNGCTDLCGTYYSSKNATASGIGPNCSGNPDDDVWFRFVAPVSGAVKITVRVFNGDHDPAFQVLNSSYDTIGIGAGACTNAFGAGIFERAFIRGLTSGQHYFIRVYHAGSSWLVGGSSSKAVFSLCVSDTITNVPPNDLCANAIPLSVSLTACVDTIVSLNNSAPSTGMSACGSGGDVWYYFISPSNSMVTLLTHTNLTMMEVYEGNCGSWSQRVSCTSISSPTASSYNISTQLGVKYYLRISSSGAVPPISPRLFCLFSLFAPTVPASNLTFSGTSSVSTQLSWTKGNGARRIVVGRVTSSSLDYPTDLVPVKFSSPVFGTPSTELLSLRDNFVLYNDTGSSVVITGLSPSTSYSFKVFEYNGINNAERYDHPTGSGTALVTLPVKFSSFHGRAYLGVAYLSWSTSSELNNIGFDLERSFDMVHFNKIGFVKGNGTTSNSSVYSFNDIEAFAYGNPIAYYRLKQVDYDGRFEYSSLVKVSEAEVIKDKEWSVFPNPFEKEINLSFEHPLNEKAKLVIYDIRGKEMYSVACDLYSGTNKLSIAEIDYLNDGMYFLQVLSTSGNKTVKIIKGQ